MNDEELINKPSVIEICHRFVAQRNFKLYDSRQLT